MNSSAPATSTSRTSPPPAASPATDEARLAGAPLAHPALRPGQIRGLALRNRAVVAPMSRVSTTGDGVPTPAMAAYYGQFSAGGFSLIITEGTYTDEAYSQGYHDQPGIVNPAQVAG